MRSVYQLTGLRKDFIKLNELTAGPGRGPAVNADWRIVSDHSKQCPA